MGAQASNTDRTQHDTLTWTKVDSPLATASCVYGPEKKAGLRGVLQKLDKPSNRGQHFKRSLSLTLTLTLTPNMVTYYHVTQETKGKHLTQNEGNDPTSHPTH